MPVCRLHTLHIARKPLIPLLTPIRRHLSRVLHTPNRAESVLALIIKRLELVRVRFHPVAAPGRLVAVRARGVCGTACFAQEWAEERDAGEDDGEGGLEAGEDVRKGDGVGYVGEIHGGEDGDAVGAYDAGAFFVLASPSRLGGRGEGRHTGIQR